MPGPRSGPDLSPQAGPGQPAAEVHSGGQPEADHAGFLHRLATSPMSGFVPWVLFWVIGGPSTWETASSAALLAAILLVIPSIWSPGRRPDLRRIKLLDAGTALFFAALVIIALATTRSDVAQLDRYAQPLSSGALALIAIGSIIVGHPFTVDYAREAAPQRVWHTAAFKKINLVLTAVWAGVFAICAVLGLLAVHVTAKGARDWLNWYLPIALIFAGVWLNRWYPSKVRAEIQRGSSRPS